MFECTAQELDDLFDSSVGHKLRFDVVSPSVHRSSFLQSLDVFIHNPRGGIMHLHVPDDGGNIVDDHRIFVFGNPLPLNTKLLVGVVPTPYAEKTVPPCGKSKAPHYPMRSGDGRKAEPN